MSSSGGAPAAWAGNPTPKSFGFTAASGDPGIMPTSSAMTTGRIYVCPCYVDHAEISNNMYLSIVAANGVAITTSFQGIYDTNGNLLAQTADRAD